jgi:dTDP-4-amino-4,6-dideoxygalactose transaminase
MTERVPFLDLRGPYAELKPEMDAAIARVLASGWFLLGDELTQFESEFATYVGAEHCIGTANGLDALTLALRAFGVGPGDEVLVPSNTFIASWLAVTYAGATPVPIEPDASTYNMDPALIDARSDAGAPVRAARGHDRYSRDCQAPGHSCARGRGTGTWRSR